MFTGIIDHCGSILSIETMAVGKRIWIACQFDDLVRGESIAVNGACLTVTEMEQGRFGCDVSPETLELTNIHYLKSNDSVNLERSLRLMDRLGGHYVMGHVDQMCQVQERRNYLPDYVHFRFCGLNQDACLFLIKKGSVAVNGVSLTLNNVDPDGFEVMLIPETLRRTNLNDLQPGDWVNIEYDFLAKSVAHQLANAQSFFVMPA